jgi:hypothetical protein
MSNMLKWAEEELRYAGYDINDPEDGKPYKSHYTSRDSRVNIEFPWTQPDEREYVFVPTEEFPNEVNE